MVLSFFKMVNVKKLTPEIWLPDLKFGILLAVTEAFCCDTRVGVGVLEVIVS